MPVSKTLIGLKDKLTIYLLDDGSRPEFAANAKGNWYSVYHSQKHDFFKAVAISTCIEQSLREYMWLFLTVTIFDALILYNLLWAGFKRRKNGIGTNTTPLFLP